MLWAEERGWQDIDPEVDDLSEFLMTLKKIN
jgi:hypothetical protein